MGNYHKVDKGELFIQEGMTLITEVDSDKYLDLATRKRRTKQKEEVFTSDANYLEHFED